MRMKWKGNAIGFDGAIMVNKVLKINRVLKSLNLDCKRIKQT